MKLTTCVLALLAPIAAQAAVTTVYSGPTAEADFTSHMDAARAYVEDFDSYVYGSPFDGTSTQADFGPVNGYSYTAFAATNLWSNNSSLSTNSAEPLTITFTGAEVTAVGGRLTATDMNGNTISQDVIASLNDGTSITINGDGFFGFTSDKPITSLTLTPDESMAQNFAQLDHFYVGAVPEPAGLLSCLGASGLLMARRRTKK